MEKYAATYYKIIIQFLFVLNILAFLFVRSFFHSLHTHVVGDGKGRKKMKSGENLWPSLTKGRKFTENQKNGNYRKSSIKFR